MSKTKKKGRHRDIPFPRQQGAAKPGFTPSPKPAQAAYAKRLIGVSAGR